MSNACSNYRCILDSDGELSIKSNITDWCLISDNTFTKIDVILDLINVRDRNTGCEGFIGE